MSNKKRRVQQGDALILHPGCYRTTADSPQDVLSVTLTDDTYALFDCHGAYGAPDLDVALVEHGARTVRVEVDKGQYTRA